MERILGGECVDLESVILDRSRRLRGLPLGVSNLELEIGIGRENPGLRVEFEFELHTGGRVVIRVVRVFRIVRVIQIVLFLLNIGLSYQIRLKIFLSKEISFLFLFLRLISSFSCFLIKRWLVSEIERWWWTSEFLWIRIHCWLAGWKERWPSRDARCFGCFPRCLSG